MSRSRSILFPLFAVLVAAVLWFVYRDVAERDDVDQLPTVAKEDDAELTQKNRSQGSAHRIEQRDAPAAGATEAASYRRALVGLRGRLIWEESRKPIAGVEIRAVELWLGSIVPNLADVVASDVSRAPFVFRAKTTTADDGTFALAGVHGRANLLLAIGLQTDKAAVRFVDRVPGPGGEADLGDIALRERGTVTGRVLADGAPVAGARVRVADIPAALAELGVAFYDPEGLVLIKQGEFRVVIEMPDWVRRFDALLPFGDARTDADGKFRVQGVRPGQSTALVRAPGRAPFTRLVRVRSKRESRLGTVRLREGATLSGRFVDPEGKPVPGVHVAAGGLVTLAPFGFLSKPVEVDDDGRFAMAGLPRGKLWFVYQRGVDDPWSVSGPHRGGDDLRIVLAPLREGRVRVVDESAQPLDAVTFAIYSLYETAYLPGLERRLDAKRHLVKDARQQGRWLVRGLEPGEYKVVATARGHAIGAGIVDLTRDSPQETTIRLARAPRITFEAVDTAGHPVSGARIYWNASSGRADSMRAAGGKTRLLGVPILLGRTDDSGKLETSGVEAGASRFLCRHPGFALQTSGKQSTSDAVPIRFVLRPGGHVEGRVTESGRPPQQGMTLIATPLSETLRQFRGAMMPRFTATMPDGGFSFRHLDPGRWRIDVLPLLSGPKSSQQLAEMYLGFGGNKGSREVVVVESRTTALHFELAGARKREGTCAIVGTVRIGGQPARGGVVETRYGGRKRRVSIDDGGAFSLEGLPDGEHWVRVEMPSERALFAQRLFEKRIELKSAARHTMHLDLATSGLRIEIHDSNNRPLRGILCVMRGPATLRGVTDAAGAIELARAPVGRYSLVSEQTRESSWVIAETSIEVHAGSSGRVHRVRAQPVIVLEGSVTWELGGLEPDEREFAARRTLEHIVLESSGRYAWSRIRTRGGRPTFRMKGLAPGTWRFVKGGPLGWAADDLVIPAGGLDHVRVRMKPDPKRVRSELARSGRRRR